MEVNVIKNEKNQVDFEVDSVTMAELIHVYLNRDSAVELAVWKRDHPTEKPFVTVRTKGKTAKKAIDDAISAIEKDLDKVLGDFKKLK
jgi:DNA-directed RNA polymerase subunit L